MKWWLVLAVVVCGWAVAAEKPAASGAAKDPKQKGGEAMENVKITPEARKVLEEVERRYQNLKTLHAKGTHVASTVQSSGNQRFEQSITSPFELSFKTPNQYLLVKRDQEVQTAQGKASVPSLRQSGCTGVLVYHYAREVGRCSTLRVERSKLDEGEAVTRELRGLCESNLPVVFLVAKSPLKVLFQFSESIAMAKQSADGLRGVEVTCRDGGNSLITVDESGIIRAFRREIVQKGANTIITFNFDSVETDIALDATQFEWVVPKGVIEQVVRD